MQLIKRINELQNRVMTDPGAKLIENWTRLLTPFSFLLTLARSQIKDFAAHIDPATLKIFCLIFTRLPPRIDAETVSLELSSAIVKNWIEAMLKQPKLLYHFDYAVICMVDLNLY